MAFSHEGWTTDLIPLGVGLRQGCSASPMFFRWVLQDTLEPLQQAWVETGYGMKLDENTLTHLARADDTWSVSEGVNSLGTMLQDVSKMAEAETGLQIRWGKCNLAIEGAEAGRDTVITPEQHLLLSIVTRVWSGQSLTSLDTTIQTGSQYDAEWEAARRKCWAAYLLRKRFWRVKGHARDNLLFSIGAPEAGI